MYILRLTLYRDSWIVDWMGQCNRTAINVVIDVGYNEGPCAWSKVGDMILHVTVKPQ